MQIADWLSQESSCKKILVTKNVRNATKLVRKCNAEGIVRFNTEIRSIKDLARETVIAYYASEGSIVRIEETDENSCCAILYEILAETVKDMNFLPVESLSLGTAAEILKSINKIRLNAVTRKYRQSSDIKIAELKAIILSFEGRLRKSGKYDYPMLLREACDILSKGDYMPKGSYALLKSHDYTRLELEFVKLISKGQLSVVGYCGNKIKGSIIPFRAYGITGEADYVTDYIEKNNIPLGEVNVYYTNSEYEGFLHAAFGSKNIPCTFTSGYSALGTDYISFMCDILKWAENDFLYSALKKVITNPKLHIEGNSSPYRSYIGSASDEIVWGINAYKGYIIRKRKELKYSAEENERKEKELAFLNFLDDLTDIFNAHDSISELYDRLYDFAEKYTYSSNEEKKYISVWLKNEALLMKQLQSIAFPSIREETAFIRERIESLNIKDTERTDAVNVVMLNNAEITERRYNFIIGLSSAHFNSRIVESPVLSDRELKMYIRGNKGLAAHINDKRTAGLMTLLRTADKDALIFIGYSVFDTVGMKEMSPSAAYISLASDYENTEVYNTYGRELTDTPVKINDSERLWQRFGSTPEEYKYEYSPEQPLALSATSFQELMNCPQQYYYKRVLKIKEESFGRRDSGTWLSSLAKGNFVHKIMELYVNEEFINNPSANENINEALFSRLFDALIKEYSKIYLYDKKYVFERERDELSEKLRVYIGKLHKEVYNGKWQPVACEKHFDGLLYTVEDDNNSKTISIEGCIDRIDCNAEGEHRIIDYKTGDPKNWTKYPQHIIYPRAFENTVSFVYAYMLSDIFKEAENIGCIDEDSEARLKETLLQGRYIADDGDTCEYCSYRDICLKKMG